MTMSSIVKRTLWMLGAAVVIICHAPAASAQAIAMECTAGRYAETTKSAAGGMNCGPRGTGRGLAITIKPSPPAYVDDPACGQGENTDQPARDLARAAAAERPPTWVPSFKDFWSRFLRRASSFGGDLGSLAQGEFVGKSGSRCQIFVVPVPVPPGKITAIEFLASHGGRAQPCFRTGVRRLSDSKDPNPIARTSGGCNIGDAGWRSGLVFDNKDSAVVAAVFKNWSSRAIGTGVIWVWY